MLYDKYHATPAGRAHLERLKLRVADRDAPVFMQTAGAPVGSDPQVGCRTLEGPVRYVG
jgi:hypothetical protein